MLRRRAERAEEDEALDTRPLGGAQQAPRRQAVELLEAGGGLVAPRAGEVHHRPDAAQRVPERGRIGQVAECELDPDPGRAEPSRVADQTPDRRPTGSEARQQRRSDPSRGAGEQEHGPGA